jgi:Tudor domain
VFQHYSNSSTTCPCSGELTEESVYACQFSEDDGWYRVRVESLGADGCVSVRYVDYGNTELVSRRRLRLLEDKFLTKISLASGFSSNSSQSWDLSCEDAFSAMLFVTNNPLHEKYQAVYQFALNPQIL